MTDLDKLAKPFLKDIRPYKPGKPIEQLQRERGIKGPIAKLASNENPYPPHEKIKQAVIEALESTNRYPETGSPLLTDELAKIHGVGRDEVIVANGTNEILDMLIRAYVRDDENCVFSQLSFVIYSIVCKQNGIAGVEVPHRDYTHDLSAMAEGINDKTKMVLLCNPNNPTGTYNTAGDVESFLDKVPDHVLVIIDEAYYDYVRAVDYPNSFALRKNNDRIIILRTFSKFHSLAGVRIGYGVADRRIVDILNKIRQPFNVNRIAQAAGRAALACRDELKWIVDETISERDKMRKAILDMGCECPPSQTNFLFVIPHGYDGDVVDELETQGIIVRPMSHFGAPTNSFRVNTGTPEENKRFLEAFSSLLAEGRTK